MRIFTIILLLFPLFAFSQKERSEFYLKIDTDNQFIINDLSQLISIDKVKDNQVFAYANTQQLAKLRSRNLNFELLTSPSLLHEAQMSNTVSKTKEWNSYPTYEVYIEMMQAFANDFPEICSIHNIGQTVDGRDLLVVKISDNVNQDEPEPEFFYTSSMHGDELTGYILMLRLIDYLLNEYTSNEQIRTLVNNVEIWINPLANPDGAYYSGNHTVNGATRFNANSVDLNRNFPAPEYSEHPDGNEHQPETIAMMNFMTAHNFTMSANFHGGVEVLNYPWDRWAERHADDDWFQYICRQYADTAHNYSSNYLTDFENGITNGYDWYMVYGGRQDYATYYNHGREVTIEISEIKMPVAATLPNYWEYNYRSLISYIEQCTYGLSGIVTDSETGNPIKAKIKVLNHDTENSHVYSSNRNGSYSRLLTEGIYEIEIEAYGYYSQIAENVQIQNFKKNNLDFELTPWISEISENNASTIKIFPNPVKDTFTVSFSDLSISECKISLINTQGISVYESVLQTINTQGIRTINLQNLESGIYYCIFEFKEHITIKQICKL